MSSAFWQLAPTAPDAAVAAQARHHQTQLTKPPGALGQLEALAITLAAQQGRVFPQLQRPWITVFAGDHGVCEEGVSAFPQAVTAQMVANFAAGGAAINVLAQQLDATLEVVNLGTVAPLPPLAGVRDAAIMPGTANLCRTPAMTTAQCIAALAEGDAAAARAADAGSDLFIGGEMGIGNTTAAAALASALLACDPAALAGPGTGLAPAGVQHKVQVLRAALARHGTDREPLTALASLGGLELAGMAGAFIGAAQRGIPVLVDGFIATAAALAACRLQPALRPWLHFGHRSGEPGHSRLLNALDASPLLDLGLRLGEGSGAAAAVPLLKLACALHRDMATFADAGISGA